MSTKLTVPISEEQIRSLKVGDQAYRFCCEGCRGIYEMLHDIQAPPGGADEISANPGKDEK